MASLNNVALPWYREEDWQALMTVFADGSAFETDYQGWRQSAEGLARILETEGQSVRRIVIDPQGFMDWCTERGLEPDADARIAFADEAVLREDPLPASGAVEFEVMETESPRAKTGKRKGARKPGSAEHGAGRTH